MSDYPRSSLNPGLDVPPEERYAFGKPMWRKGVPFTLLLLLWIPAALLWKGQQLLPPDSEHPAVVFARLAFEWLAARDVTLERTVFWSGILSVPLVLLFYTGLERLIVTPTMIVRGYPLLPKRRIRWADLDEVLVDHLEARMEGEESAKRTLTLYTRRGRFMPVRRKFRVTNRQFDGYEEVERMAVAVGVPAIADRLKRRINETAKPARFPVRSLRERSAAGTAVILAVVFVAVALYKPIWQRLAESSAAAGTEQEVPAVLQAFGLRHFPNPLALPAAAPVRPILFGTAALLLVFAGRRLWYQQLAVDHEHMHLMRRGKVRRSIPLDTIADIQVLGNVMRIYAYRRDTDEDPKLVWKTSRFIRNRGVLLCLIREIYDGRRNLDLTPIVPMRALPAPEQKPA